MAAAPLTVGIWAPDVAGEKRAAQLLGYRAERDQLARPNQGLRRAGLGAALNKMNYRHAGPGLWPRRGKRRFFSRRIADRPTELERFAAWQTRGRITIAVLPIGTRPPAAPCRRTRPGKGRAGPILAMGSHAPESTSA